MLVNKDLFKIMRTKGIREPRKQNNTGIILIICCFLAGLILFFAALARSSPSMGESIDVNIIAQIETNANPNAISADGKDYGLCQIREPALKEYNKANHTSYALNDLLNAHINLTIADWYINYRIPEMLAYYKIDDMQRNRIWAYNAGIKKVVTNKLPERTLKYINQYNKLQAGE